MVVPRNPELIPCTREDLGPGRTAGLADVVPITLVCDYFLSGPATAALCAGVMLSVAGELKS